MPEFEDKINALAEQGYRINSINHDQGIATMSLKSSPNIQNAEDFMNLPIGADINIQIQNGWIPIANYSKHITLMKMKDDPCERCERITRDEAYQLVIENPPERGI